MDGCNHHLDGHEFGSTLGFGDGQGGLMCYGSWGRKESVTTERLNRTDEFTSQEEKKRKLRLDLWERQFEGQMKEPEFFKSYCEEGLL